MHPSYLILPIAENPEDLDVYFSFIEEAYSIDRMEVIDAFLVFHYVHFVDKTYNLPHAFRDGMPVDIVEFLVNWLVERQSPDDPCHDLDLDEIIPVFEETMGVLYRNLYLTLNQIHFGYGIPGPLSFLKWHGRDLVVAVPDVSANVVGYDPAASI